MTGLCAAGGGGGAGAAVEGYVPKGVWWWGRPAADNREGRIGVIRCIRGHCRRMGVPRSVSPAAGGGRYVWGASRIA
jgi:hypothetical protein